MVLASHPAPSVTRPIAHAPVVVLDTRLRVRGLNRAARQLAGSHVGESRGRPAQAVIDARRGSGGPVFDRNSQAIRMLAAGWAPPPERVRIGGETRLLTLLAIDQDDDVLIIATFGPPLQREDRMAEACRLTGRQREVLVSIADGRRCEETAADLGISMATVRHHIRSILAAFGVHSQLAAVAEARRAGIV